MVQKLQALDKLGRQLGFGVMRVMTDVSAERYWMSGQSRRLTDDERLPLGK